jgi:hypothetical protein
MSEVLQVRELVEWKLTGNSQFLERQNAINSDRKPEADGTSVAKKR